ncbi:short-chain dehydrogenase [Penicillium freii]|nr:short-chain dehydrogenase [Penicillium freii]
MLPKLRQAEEYSIVPRIMLVASNRHVMTNLPEWKTGNTLQQLLDLRGACMLLLPAKKLSGRPLSLSGPGEDQCIGRARRIVTPN